MNKIKICMAQIEVIPADPQANLKKILACIEKAKNDKADIICLSEMVVPGYLLGDMWERESFLNECEYALYQIRKASNGIVVVVGSIGFDHGLKNEDGRIRKYNSCFIFHNDKVKDVIYKSLQPNYREFDDNRHFYDGRKLIFDYRYEKEKNGEEYLPKIKDYYGPSLKVNGLNFGFCLCEDAWSNDYSISPVDILYENGCDIIFNISCSPYTHGKDNKRNRVFGGHAKKHGKPLVYVNNVGAQNNGKAIYTFDGNSCIYDKNGNQLNPYKPFTEGCETFEIDVDASFGDVNYQEKDDIGMVHDAIVYGTRKLMEQMGIEKVVVGASGGIDSAVVAALMSEILPPEKLMLVNMPSSHNSSVTKNAAEKLAKNLKCIYKVIPIQDSVDLTRKQLKKVGLDLNSFALENVQARDRSSRILSACASAFGGVFTCNANKSECTVGYTTLYGDLAGFLAPICDLWKTQVYGLARYINREVFKEAIIPIASIDVVPSAELSSSQDVTKGLGDPINYPYHDQLFASWIERWDRATPEDNLKWYHQGLLEQEIGWNGHINELFCDADSFIKDLERWWNCFAGLSIAKRIQSPPLICVSRRSYGFDMRETQIKPYYSEGYRILKKQLLGGNIENPKVEEYFSKAIKTSANNLSKQIDEDILNEFINGDN